MKAEEETPITPDKNLIYAKIGGCLRNNESIYAVKVVSDLMEQYAELCIQQEREKWKEEVIKVGEIFGCYATQEEKDEVIRQVKEYYETQVKPRIEGKAK